jgi:hypothetical protein
VNEYEWDLDDPSRLAMLEELAPAPENNGGAAVVSLADRIPTPWLVDAADLLAEPDPGPTQWLVDGLIVDPAICAVVGSWKTTKSWAMLEVAVSIATGKPAFASHAIPIPGPVIFVIEESGRKALWRRLDALCRGRAIKPEDLRGKLHLAMNERVKLDDTEWQERLVDMGHKIKPRAYFFDPLARMKAPGRNESDQTEMAPLLDFLTILRDETEATPAYVHHTGHQGNHMRGTSDLETHWESKLSFTRDGDDGIVKVVADHRDEEGGVTVNYKLVVDGNTRTIRLRPTLLPLQERILEYLIANGPSTTKEVRDGVDTREQDVARELENLKQAGSTLRGYSHRTDSRGAPTTAKLWEVSKQATLSDA